MSLPNIEDEFEDVLGKAMHGRGLSAGELATRAGISRESCESLLSGEFDESGARRLAQMLDLNADCLLKLANNPSKPEVNFPEGIRLHNTPFPVRGYEAMTINSYSLLPPEESKPGILIDAGSGFASIFAENQEGRASQWSLLLTHTHADHVVHFEGLSRIVAKAYAPVGEPYSDALPIQDGDVLDFAAWRLKAIETPGHSPGGMSYLVEGPSVPIAFVGDALFCYSIGKVNGDYEATLALIRERILSLPGETILCPGHGPPTTVEFEEKHNPFFA